MKLQSISTIFRAGALAALFVVGTSAAAFALPIVNFGTTGTFSGGTGVISGGGAIVTFTDADGTEAALAFLGDPNQSLDAPSNVQYGNILLAVTPGEQFDGDISGTNFTLTITQTAPTAGSADLQSFLTGTILKANQTDFVLQFTDLTAQIGDVIYKIGSGGEFGLVPPAEGSLIGQTTIQGSLRAVPEPTTMMLLGTGLLAAFRARRKTA